MLREKSIRLSIYLRELCSGIMKFIHIRVNDKCIAKTDNIKEALKIIKDLFNKGYDDVYVYGSRIGKWM